MKSVNIYKFTECIDSWDKFPGLSGDQFLRETGLLSVVFDRNEGIWMMSEHDYLMFLMRWG